MIDNNILALFLKKFRERGLYKNIYYKECKSDKSRNIVEIIVLNKYIENANRTRHII